MKEMHTADWRVHHNLHDEIHIVSMLNEVDKVATS